jgi:hypothetical protein
VWFRVVSCRSPTMVRQCSSRRASRDAAAARISPAHVERTRWRIRLDALAVRLAALDGVLSGPRQTSQPCRPDEHGLRHDGRTRGNGPAAILRPSRPPAARGDGRFARRR